MTDVGATPVLVIGLGNELRRDDGAGFEIARRARDRARQAGIEVREHHGQPIELLDIWCDCDVVVVVDTMRSGAPPGTLRRMDATDAPLPVTHMGSSSTHAVGLEETIELARALHRLPARVVVYAVEGHRFDTGPGLTHELEAAVSAAVQAVLGEAFELARDRRGASARGR